MPLSPSPALSPALVVAASGGAPLPSAACDACSHVLEGHDAIGRRFCRATLEGALTRGCICRSS